MVDIQKFVNFDAAAECDINERVRFSVLAEILGECGDDEEALKDAVRSRKDELIPKHIIIDDIFSSINYMNCLAVGLGTVDDIDHLGKPPHPLGGRIAAEPVPYWFFPVLERVIRERMTLQAQDLEVLTPHSLIKHPSPWWLRSRNSLALRRCPSLWIRPTRWRS